MRYLQLDALRGVMLISMVVGHLGADLPLGLSQHLAFKSLLINDAAAGFVFLSGLTVGLAYTKGWTDPAYISRKRAVWARSALVFSHHAFLVAIVSVLAFFSWQSGRQLWIFEHYGDAPLLYGVLSLFLVSGGWFMNILPIYVVFLLFTPVALSAATNGYRWAVMLIIATTWLIGQAGLMDTMLIALEDVFGLAQWNVRLGIYFDRLSWLRSIFLLCCSDTPMCAASSIYRFSGDGRWRRSRSAASSSSWA